jgi:biotin-(acetyl-CoA carboxylase) ligase
MDRDSSGIGCVLCYCATTSHGVGSTSSRNRFSNADLLARAAKGENIDDAVPLAEHQSAGRGRHGRSWTTPLRSQIALSAGSVPYPTKLGAGCRCSLGIAVVTPWATSALD